LYADLIHTVRKMPKDKQGELFMTILQYVNDENPIVDDLLIDLVFEPIKRQMKRDLVKYETTKERRRELGRLAGLKSGEARKANVPESNQNEPKRTNGSKNEPNEHVTVTVNDTVTVNGTVTVTDILLEKETKEEFKKVSISKNEIFSKEVLESETWIETISMQNRITPEEIPKWLDDFNKKLISELDTKISKKEYASHFSRWLPGEILKSKNQKNERSVNNPTGTKKQPFVFSAQSIIDKANAGQTE
jgi:hypothetical protein